jgi:PAS domain-containing protein
MPHRLQEVDLWLVDILVVPASLHDVDGRFVHMNAAAERASGSTNAQLLGHHFSEPLHPQFRRAVELGEPTAAAGWIDSPGVPPRRTSAPGCRA